MWWRCAQLVVLVLGSGLAVWGYRHTAFLDALDRDGRNAEQQLSLAQTQWLALPSDAQWLLLDGEQALRIGDARSAAVALAACGFVMALWASYRLAMRGR